MPGPLNGITILDLTSVIMGPYATQILADYGATVIKVESPEGDIMRYNGKAGARAMGPVHLALNRGKRLLALNLKTEDGRAALLRLAERSDVFLHNMRPAAVERLDLGYDAVRAVRPDIVYVGACGFGQGGRYAQDPAYDDMIQGVSGLAKLMELLAGEPRFVPTVIADKVSGLCITHALLAALLHREKSGQGQQVEVPMFESIVSFLMVEHLWDRTHEPNGDVGYSRVLSQIRRPYPTADGHVCALPYNDRNWRDFFALAGEPETASDPRFATHNARSQNYPALYERMTQTLSRRPTAFWLRELRARNIPVAPVQRLEDLFEDPHLADVGLFRTVEHPTEGPITAVDCPTRFSATQAALGTPAGRIGENTREVLRWAGFAEAEVESLLAKGAAAAPESQRAAE